MEALYPVERIVKMATCMKLVKNGKINSKRFSKGCFCYVEPVEISSMCCLKDVKPVKRAQLEQIKSFKYHHSTIGYKGKYLGPNIEECMFAILDNLSVKQAQDIYKAGVAFSVKEISGLSYEDMENLTTTVEITVYKDKSGKLPEDIVGQTIKYKGEEHKPNEQVTKTFASGRSF